VTGDVRQVQADEAGETWELITGDELRQVTAEWVDEAGGWMVTVDMMQCIREEPLEGELRRRIAAALQSVEGARTVEEEDREVWLVTGTPPASALVRASAAAVDSLTGQIEEAFAIADARERGEARRSQGWGRLLRGRQG
jgi:hypothetical protein